MARPIKNKEFQSRVINERGSLRAQKVRELFDGLLTLLVDPRNVVGDSDADEARDPLVPPGREAALVKTKLEEACFFAVKGCASDPLNQAT